MNSSYTHSHTISCVDGRTCPPAAAGTATIRLRRVRLRRRRVRPRYHWVLRLRRRRAAGTGGGTAGTASSFGGFHDGRQPHQPNISAMHARGQAPRGRLQQLQ